MTLRIATEGVIDAWRAAFEQMSVGAVLIAGALDSETTTALRAGLAARVFRRFDLAHRGRYQHCDVGDAPLCDGLQSLAERVCNSSLRIDSVRCMRLVHGDYCLRESQPSTSQIEVTVDLSATSSDEGQVVYAHRGQNFFVVPNQSGVVAVVDRQPSVERYDRYLNHQIGDAVIYRVRVILSRR